MTSGAVPWVDVPGDWLDDEYGSEPGLRKFQEFVGIKVKAAVLRKHLLAEGIGKPGELEIENIRVGGDSRRCTIVTDFKVTGMAWKVKDATGLFVENKKKSEIKSDKVNMTRIIKKDNSGTMQSATFVSIGVGTARLPDDFGNEYYKRVIPFLQKIGVKSVDTVAITEANDPANERGRLLGGYVWCKYGYTNQDVDGAIKEFLKYLHNDRKARLSNDEASAIKSLPRMIDMAEHEIYRDGQWLKVGKDFLLGDDGAGKYTRDVLWIGVIPDINNRESEEMKELAKRLDKHK